MSIKYEKLTHEELREHFKNFLIESWGYSKVASFARNEKAFEMQYVYRMRGRSSASTVAGSAYHLALDKFFKLQKEDKKLDIVKAQEIAFDYIERVSGNSWKLQKTTPTVDKCIEKATKVATALLNNFYSEIAIYTDEIKEVLSSEEKITEWVTVNGVDVPMPCTAISDLAFKSKDGKNILLDHKSKTSFTDDKDMQLTGVKQCMANVLTYEKRHDIKIDEFWFVENKHSKNRDGSSQFQIFKIVLDDDKRRLYESMLYEPLRRMIEAVSDPDYIYLVNDSDSFTDKAELFDFWMQTLTAEVSDFDIPENKKSLIAKRLKKVKDSSVENVSPSVIKSFKKKAASFIQFDLSKSDMTKSEKIEHALRVHGKIVSVQHSIDGYSSDTFLISVSAGVTVQSIYKHRLDIANALDVASVRISKDLVLYEGKSYLAIEANKKREKDLVFDPKYLSDQKIPVGIDNFDRVTYWDLNNPSTPHFLICGATGSGKSVSAISTVEYALAAGIEDIVIFDPKFEFEAIYKDHPSVRTFSHIEDIESEMRSLVIDMQIRVKNRISKKTIVIFDEFADAVAQSAKGRKLNVYETQIMGYTKEGIAKTKKVHVDTLLSLEENLAMLLQKGRSCGFRIISLTQRASVKVLNGDAKVNFPVRMCLRVPTATDSKVVLDEIGAESLAGAGDALFQSPEYLETVRIQCFYIKK